MPKVPNFLRKELGGRLKVEGRRCSLPILHRESEGVRQGFCLRFRGGLITVLLYAAVGDNISSARCRYWQRAGNLCAACAANRFFKLYVLTFLIPSGVCSIRMPCEPGRTGRPWRSKVRDGWFALERRVGLMPVGSNSLMVPK